MKFLLLTVYFSFMLATKESNILTRLRSGYDNDNLLSENDFPTFDKNEQEIIVGLLKKSLDGIEKIALRLEDAVDLIDRLDRKTLVEHLKNSSQGLNMVYLMIKEKASFTSSHPQKVYLIVKDAKGFLDDIMYLLLMSLRFIDPSQDDECDSIVSKSIGELADVISNLDEVIKTLEELGYDTEHLNKHPSCKDSEDSYSYQGDDPSNHIIENNLEESNHQNKTENEKLFRLANGRPNTKMSQTLNSEPSAWKVVDNKPQSAGSQQNSSRSADFKASAINDQNGSDNAVQKITVGKPQIVEPQKPFPGVTNLNAGNIQVQNNNSSSLHNIPVSKPQITRSQRSTIENISSQVTIVKPQNNVKNVKAQNVNLNPVKSMHDEINAKEKDSKGAISKVSASDSHSTAQGVISKAFDGKSQSKVENDKSRDKVKSIKARSNVTDVKSQGVVSKINESNKQKVAVLKDVKPVLPNKKHQDKKSQCINGILYGGAPLSCISLTFTISRS
ncbi:hypothetical protein NBO_10g0097 [Nosema bombycis CQ1]|uniref:Uncharacterized protein n=1 Tax=Nosema bombycis (strain CQ1 / CVCC 102059) TaxID=578461 RepID=R0KY12_NOSB1|nr:hypothetical protein NBO_10g0097 [Nosema bombycis CQ1]|eukprot:EOB15107.1 hypothetical protein NBO_10g0097 [Nosema bombycis CQ1]